MKTNKPTRKMLKRKVVVDDVGTAYVVGKLSKADLQILVCALDDDLRELRENACLQCGNPRQSDPHRCDACLESD